MSEKNNDERLCFWLGFGFWLFGVLIAAVIAKGGGVRQAFKGFLCSTLCFLVVSVVFIILENEASRSRACSYRETAVDVANLDFAEDICAKVEAAKKEVEIEREKEERKEAEEKKRDWEAGQKQLDRIHKMYVAKKRQYEGVKVDDEKTGVKLDADGVDYREEYVKAGLKEGVVDEIDPLVNNAQYQEARRDLAAFKNVWTGIAVKPKSSGMPEKGRRLIAAMRDQTMAVIYAKYCGKAATDLLSEFKVAWKGLASEPVAAVVENESVFDQKIKAIDTRIVALDTERRSLVVSKVSLDRNTPRVGEIDAELRQLNAMRSSVLSAKYSRKSDAATRAEAKRKSAQERLCDQYEEKYVAEAEKRMIAIIESEP